MEIIRNKKRTEVLSRNIPALIILFKVFLIGLFSSDYQDKLFIPFVSQFLSNPGNTWEYFYQNNLPVEFPYHPLMLYVLSVFYAPVHYIFGDLQVVGNVFFMLPVLIADFVIYKLLRKVFPANHKEIVLFYFASPIIIYASYIHSQLDLIPTAVLFTSVYFLIRNDYLKSALFLGLALSIKLHVLAAMPLLIIYLLRKDKTKEIFTYISLSAAVYLFFLLPYLNSEGFIQMVFNNPKQKSLFDSSVVISNLKIFLPLLASILIYTRFLLYKKVNNDLLYTFLAILFSVFVILIPPSPAWYIWLFPFLSIFFIKNYSENNKTIYLYTFLNIFYLLFFVVFYMPEFVDIKFLDQPVSIKIDNGNLSSASFTALAATLLGCIYAFYNFGVRSNSIYKKENSILIGLGGDSGSGKSTLLSDLKLILGNKITDVEGDGDHKWERHHDNWKDFTHLDPKANFLHKQAEDLLALKQGKNIYRSEYDHDTGKFTTPRLIKSRDYIAISGLHPFYLPVMRKIIDLKIFVDTDERLRLHWKILRDTQKRGYSRERIIEQIEKRSADSQKYISPQKSFADIVVNYFSEEIFEIGDEKCQPKVKLKIVLHSDIHMEPLLQKFYQHDLKVIWDYSEDLKSQFLVFDEEYNSETIEELAKDIIINIEELTPQQITWQSGYRGLVQLLILYSLSDRLKVLNKDNN